MTEPATNVSIFVCEMIGAFDSSTVLVRILFNETEVE